MRRESPEYLRIRRSFIKKGVLQTACAVLVLLGLHSMMFDCILLKLFTFVRLFFIVISKLVGCNCSSRVSQVLFQPNKLLWQTFNFISLLSLVFDVQFRLLAIYSSWVCFTNANELKKLQTQAKSYDFLVVVVFLLIEDFYFVLQCNIRAGL